MDKEKKAVNYNTAGHNCCSVAYHAVKEAGGDLEQVDPTCFNLYGMGIHWGQTLGNITDYFLISTWNGIRFSGEIFSFSPSECSSSLTPSSSSSSSPLSSEETRSNIDEKKEEDL